MNKKDYKEIANRIKEAIDFCEANKLLVCPLKTLANRIADYFEKEDINRNNFPNSPEYWSFDKEQFLRDSGVKT